MPVYVLPRLSVKTLLDLESSLPDHYHGADTVRDIMNRVYAQGLETILDYYSDIDRLLDGWEAIATEDEQEGRLNASRRLDKIEQTRATVQENLEAVSLRCRNLLKRETT